MLSIHQTALNNMYNLFIINENDASIQVDITLWGTKVVKLNNHPDAVSINKVAQELFTISTYYPHEQNDLSLDRFKGLAIQKKLNTCLKEIENILKSVSWFTYIIYWLRTFVERIFCKTEKEDLNEANRNSRLFTKKAYFQLTGQSFIPSEPNNMVIGRYHKKLFLKEEALRNYVSVGYEYIDPKSRLLG